MDALRCDPGALDGLQYWGSVYRIGWLGVWQALTTLCGQSATGAASAAAAVLQAALWVASTLLAVATAFLYVVFSNLYWAAPSVLLAAAAVGLVNLVFPSRRLMAYIAHRWPNVLFECTPQTDAVMMRKYIVLTIAEGPCYHNTPAILEVLQQCGAQATFFITGSQVQHCDRVSVGSKQEQLGRKVLERMVAEGHELANHGWSLEPAAGLPAREVRRQLLGTAQLVSEARSNAAASGSGGVAYKRTRWFRPYGWKWDASVTEVAQQHGHQVALGSIWAWPGFNRLPWFNAMYMWMRAYTGGVIMLQDRRKSTAHTLAYLLPWLKSSGFRVVTLSEAQTLSTGVGPLTAEALELHNQMFASEDSRSSQVDGEVLRGLLGPAASAAASTKGHTAPPSPVQGSQVGERASFVQQHTPAVQAVLLDEEERRRRAKAERFAAMDKKAGIDRRIVEMSAADKRRLVRIEREKKEAEKRKARRQVEEVRAKERYEAYVREQAEKQRRAAEDKAEAAAKAEVERIRRQKVLEEMHARQEAERARVERLRQERLLREAAQEAELADDANAVETASVTSQPPADKASKGLLGRMTSKLRKQLPGGNRKQQQSSSTEGEAVPPPPSAAAAAVGAGTARPLPQQQQQEVQDGQEQLLPSAAATGAVAAGAAAAAVAAAAAATAGPPAKNSFSVDVRPSDADQQGPVQGCFDKPPNAEWVAEQATGGSAIHGVTWVSPKGDTCLVLGPAANGMAPLLHPDSRQQATTAGGLLLCVLLDAQQQPVLDTAGQPVLVALSGTWPLTQGGVVKAAAAGQGSTGGSPRRHSGDTDDATILVTAAGDESELASVPHGVTQTKAAAAQHGAATAAAHGARPCVMFAVGPDGQLVTAAALRGPVQTLGSVSAESSLMRVLTTASGEVVLGPDNRPLMLAVDDVGQPWEASHGAGSWMGPSGQPVTIGVTSAGDCVAVGADGHMLSGGDAQPLVVARNLQGVPLVDDRGRLVLATGGSKPQQLLEDGKAAAADMVPNWASALHGDHLPARAHVSDGFLVVK